MKQKIGDYTVESVKSGGMGVIFFVTLGKERFVLKTIRPELISIPEIREAFKREAELWILLSSHSNVTRAYEVIEIEGKLYILVERIEPANKFNCVSVAEWLAHRAFWPLETIRCAIQSCRAMHWAQKTIPGFIHRDIKPANLLVDGINIKVNDFGLGGIAYTAACLEKPERINSQTYGETGLSIWGKRAVGTAGYMAPEVIRGDGASVRSDIYSFGVTLYEMCSGRSLFKGTPAQVNEAHLSQAPLPLRKIKPNLSPDIEAAIMRCLLKNPKERFSDFYELGKYFQEIYTDITGSALPKDFPQSESEFLHSHIESLRKIGKNSSADKLVERAKERIEHSGENWLKKGYVLYSEGQYEEAIPCFDKALKKGLIFTNQKAEAWINKGCALAGLKRYKESIPAFEEATKIDSQHKPLAWYNKGLALYTLADYPQAIICYDKAIELNPKYALAYFDKAKILNFLGKYEQALNCLEEAITLNKDLAGSQNLKQAILQKLNK